MEEFSLSKALEDPSGPIAKAMLAGPKTGRPRKIQDSDTIETLKRLRVNGTKTKDMAALLGVSASTINRYLNQYDMPSRPKRPKCMVCHWLSEQDGSETLINEVNIWIRTQRHRSELFATLVSNGLAVSETTFRNHAQNCVLTPKEQAHVAS